MGQVLIQQVLTEEISSEVFDEDDFHQRNDVAKQLYALEETLDEKTFGLKSMSGGPPGSIGAGRSR